MSVAIKCVKCNGILENAALTPDKNWWCPRCAVEFPKSNPTRAKGEEEPARQGGLHDAEVVDLLGKILAELQAQRISPKPAAFPIAEKRPRGRPKRIISPTPLA